MSGTRSHSRKAPATDTNVKPALLIVAHGERGGAGDDRLVYSLVNRMQREPCYRSVQACFISKTPTLREIFEELAVGPAVVYPLFMSDGYFVTKAIPSMLETKQFALTSQARQVRIAAPVGLNPELPRLVTELACNTARASGRSEQECRLLIVAHGSSKGTASRNATLSLVAAIGTEDRFAGIDVAFLDEAPFLDKQLESIEGPAVAVGLFAGEGMHSAVDLRRATERSGRTDIMLSPQLARCPALENLVCEELLKAAAPGSRAAAATATAIKL